MIRLRWSAGILLAALAATGCGESKAGFKGVVTLDGAPVEGATVTFVPESGSASDTAAATTDAKGEFTLYSLDKKAGVKPGSYKVTVIKVTSKGEAMAPPSPGDPGKMKEVRKEMDDAGKGKGLPGMQGGARVIGAQAAGPGGVKTELPVIYSSAESTPIKVTVPPPNQPLVIELKSKG
jgi:hypothetical protein